MIFKKMITGGVALIVGAGMVVGPIASASVFIHEILADPPTVTGDANRDGVVSFSQDEFIELYNPSSQTADISGWMIYDDLRLRHVFAADTWIKPFGLWVVFGGGNPNFDEAIYSTASTGGLGLNNNGDIVSLFDSRNVLIDQVVYGSEGGKDQSLVRSPEREKGMFVLHTVLDAEHAFSPGTFVTVSPGAGVVPEPATCLSLALGMSGIFFLKKKRFP